MVFLPFEGFFILFYENDRGFSALFTYTWRKPKILHSFTFIDLPMDFSTFFIPGSLRGIFCPFFLFHPVPTLKPF